VTLASCNKTSDTFTCDDATKIRAIINDYRTGWLEGDSAKVMNLLSDSATLIPSGLEPLHGKNVIRQFWWPNDSSKTIIHSYDITILDLGGSGDLAFTYETGSLSWSYEKGDFKMSKENHSYEITLFERAKPNQWKITRRIWTDLKQ
jgi:ketosteroid isomerase-like protein